MSAAYVSSPGVPTMRPWKSSGVGTRLGRGKVVDELRGDALVLEVLLR